VNAIQGSVDRVLKEKGGSNRSQKQQQRERGDETKGGPPLKVVGKNTRGGIPDGRRGGKRPRKGDS